MNKFFKFMLMAAIATTVSGTFMACGDDDDDNSNNGNNENAGTETPTAVNPLNVFTGGLPKSYDGAQIVTNAQGLVAAITSNDGKQITFEYPLATRDASAYDVIMTIDEGHDEKLVCNMMLGQNGFVAHVDEIEIYQGKQETETWDFTYNSNGQLTQMVRSEGGTEKTVIKYEDGNIVETSTTSEKYYDEASSYRIYYTSDDVRTAIENKGCVMLFDMTLGIDMDEMEYAYYAGLLGKATKNLPVRCVDMRDERYTDTFMWTLNNAGYPTHVAYKEYPQDQTTFTW